MNYLVITKDSHSRRHRHLVAAANLLVAWREAAEAWGIRALVMVRPA